MSETNRDDAVAAALARRFLTEPGVGEIGHVVLGALVGGMLFGLVPHLATITWYAVLLALTALRYRLRTHHGRLNADAVPSIVFVVIGLIGLWWGLGALALLWTTGAESIYLAMIVSCGLAAAATASFAASTTAFRIFVATEFLPLIVGLLLVGTSRTSITSVFLVVVFGIVMTGLHQRTFQSLVDSMRLSRELQASRDAAVSAEAEVRESEQKLFQLIERMPVGVIVLDPDSSVYYGNAAAVQIGGPGLRGGDADPTAIYPVYVPGTEERYPRDRLPAARALKGETVADQFEVRGPAGPKLIEVQGAPILNRSGGVAYGIAVLSDLGVRQGGEQRRAAMNAVLQVLAASPDDLWTPVLSAVVSRFNFDLAEIWMRHPGDNLLRRAGSARRANDARLAAFDEASAGVTFQSGVGLPGRAWRDGVPVWRNRDASEDFLFSRVGGTVEAGLRTAVAVPIHVGGQPSGVMVSFASDYREADPLLIDTLAAISAQVGGALERRRTDAELHEAERRYRDLVEASTDLVWQADLDGNWTYLNAASRQIYGLSPEKLLGRPFSEASAPDHRIADIELFGRVSLGESVTDYDTVHRDVHGIRKPLSTSASPIRDSGGNVVGVHGIARDVKTRAAAQEALRDARDAAEEAAAAKSAFLANMSHEIRTPMNGVLGMAELLLDSELDADQRRAVDLITTSGRALLEVINDILDFSKIEANQMEIEAIDFDLHELVESTVRLVTPTALGRGVEVVTDLADDVPMNVIGDPMRIRQVLSNLLGNAVKFTHQGEIVVSLKRVATGNTPRIRFDVSDSGIGMNAATVDSIFEPFRQADSSTTRRYGGTGLGLSISRRLVELMGGTLEVESQPGLGSRFSFQIDLPQGAMTAVARVPISGLRVLIVDDNSTNRRVMRGMLHGAGCLVDDAGDPLTVVANLQSAGARGEPYDVVISDVQMPGMDGFDLVERIRGTPETADLPVILASSGGRRGDRGRAATLGVYAHLYKPISKRELLHAVAGAAGRTTLDDAVRDGHQGIAVAPRPLAVLLAEDNPINQQVAASMLRRRGHTVDIVDNGRAAVAAALSRPYDLVLMDIQMPEMDGIAATREIRDALNGKHLPIIALTANALSGERERCLSAGMDNYLSKPFTARDLFAVVEGDSVAASAVPSRSKPNQAPVDLAALSAEMRDAGIEDAIPALIDLFLTDAPARIAEIEAAVGANDPARVASAAHALKSASGTLRITRLTARLTAMETAARDGDFKAAASELPAVIAEHAEAHRFLRAHLDQLV